MEAGGTFSRGKTVNLSGQGRSSSVSWQTTSLVRISYLKMERKGSGIPGRKEAEGSTSSTPWKYMARTRKVLHYVISEEEST